MDIMVCILPQSLIYAGMSRTASTSIKHMMEKTSGKMMRISKFIELGKKFDDFIVFSTIRNPYRRLISGFNNRQAPKMPHEERIELFEKLVLETTKQEWHACFNVISAVKYFKRLFDFVEDINLIRVENLREDMDKLHIFEDYSTLKKHKSMNKNKWRDYLNNSDVRNKICDIYGKDFNLLKYSKRIKIENSTKAPKILNKKKFYENINL